MKMPPNPFTTTARADGRAAYQPGQRAVAAVTRAIRAIEALDGRAMTIRERSRYTVWFRIGWMSARMAWRQQQRRAV